MQAEIYFCYNKDGYNKSPKTSASVRYNVSGVQERIGAEKSQEDVKSEREAKRWIRMRGLCI